MILSAFYALLNDIHDSASGRSGEPSAAHLSALDAFFPELIRPTLHMIDRSGVTCHIEPAGRKAYRMKDGQALYTILEPIKFCCCEFFEEHVLDKADQLLCKHLIATHLAKALGILQESIETTEFQAGIISGAYF
ncbi:hypothetical protein BV898_15032 [Hypsibius exemplaris]|uniref:SWIM-type domain-containing protein n=1 Tax=Hypsibius exemplaris TaxID=2072580 RepID=A0A9X6NBT3_HYPEX|nr:hypothetical protein BV898_15032 [Hypsibius exemplaris]